MTLKETTFDLLIPLAAKPEDIQRICGPDRAYAQGWLNEYFDPRGLRHTDQLTGSPLLDQDGLASSVRLLLRQSGRMALGLGKNTNQRYEFRGMSLKIGEIALTFFRIGSVFLRLRFLAEGLTPEQSTDLIAGLSTIRRKPRLTYLRRTSQFDQEEFSVSLPDIIEKLLSLCDGIDLAPVPEVTFIKAYCLCLTIGESDPDQPCETFLNSMRQLQVSGLSSAPDEQRFFRPFGHVTWAVGDQACVCFADLRLCSEKRRGFLEDKGGMRFTVFENYEAVYLYILSLRAYAQETEALARKALAPGADSGLSQYALERCRLAADLPLSCLTTKEHIDKLFMDHMARDLMGLPDRLTAIDRKLIPELLKHRRFDLFISYRRAGGYYAARLLYELLTRRGMNVFLDTERLGSGRFDENIYSVIEQCSAMIVVLSKGALDRREDEEDWVRREILKARQEQSRRSFKIIPALLEGASFPKDPEPGLDLSREQAVKLEPEFFTGAFSKLMDLLED